MRLILVAALCLICAAVVTQIDMTGLAHWAAGHQRAFQNQIATAIGALRSGAPGAPGALTALLGVAGAYGFVHAVGPGHGKYLLGGVGLGTEVSAVRLIGLALAASLAQALWAIALVYGGFLLLELSAQQMTVLAEDVLAPASYLAITGIGAILAWRGLRGLLARARVEHDDHDHPHGCSFHAHGLTVEEFRQTATLRDAVALVLGIAVRPCTGAIFLLVIAWQMDIRVAGAVAVLAMGFGTALLTCLVAVSSLVARGVALASTGALGVVTLAAPTLQLLAGALIVWFSLVLLSVAMA